MGGLFILGLFFFSSCQKEEMVNSNVEYVKKIFEQEGIKKYKIDIEKVSSSEFDRIKFKEFVELRSKKSKEKNNLKIFDMLAILAIAFSNFDFSISDAANNSGGGGYSCSANLGSENYGFYKGHN